MDISLRKIRPHIFIDHKAKAKIDFLVNLAVKEVGWLGSVQEVSPHMYYIKDIFLFRQEVTAVETDIDAAALTEFFYENIEIANEIRFWGHSHVNMGVTPSGTDVTTITQLQGQGAPYFIMGIFNKSKVSRFDVYTNDFIFSDVSSSVFYENYDMTDLKQEYDQKVKEKTYANYNAGNWHKGTHGNNGAGFTGHATTQSGVRSVKAQEPFDRHNRSWGNGFKDNNGAGKAGDAEDTNLGQGSGGRTQHSQSNLYDDVDWEM